MELCVLTICDIIILASHGNIGLVNSVRLLESMVLYDTAGLYIRNTRLSLL